MARALGEGGTSFDALYVNVNGESGYFDRSLAVYGQEGEPCPRCGTPIRRDAFMNRSSYTCPRCQPRPRRRGSDSASRPVRRSASTACGTTPCASTGVQSLRADPFRATRCAGEDLEVRFVGGVGDVDVRGTPVSPVGAHTQTDWHGQDWTVRAATGGVSIASIVSRSVGRERARKINLPAG